MKKTEIKIYNKGTKYARKRCDKKITREVIRVERVSVEDVKRIEKALNDGEYDEHEEYYNIIFNDGDNNYFRASHTRIMQKGKELLLNDWDIRLSNDYYYHHSATAKDYLRASEDGKIEEYSGRFGNGYIIHSQMNSSRYYLIEYYIKKGE